LAKKIAVSNEVYDLLRRSKLPRESFSSLIKRKLQKGMLSEIVGKGTITKAHWEKAKKRLQ